MSSPSKFSTDWDFFFANMLTKPSYRLKAIIEIEISFSEVYFFVDRITYIFIHLFRKNTYLLSVEIVL